MEKKMRELLTLVPIAMLVTGCVSTYSTESLPAIPPIVCKGKDDCDVKWGKALKWTTQNAAYRVVTATETMIQTAGPLPHDPRPAMQIIKTANGGDSYTFSFSGRCDNIFGCSPNLYDTEASLWSYIEGRMLPGRTN